MSKHHSDKQNDNHPDDNGGHGDDELHGSSNDDNMNGGGGDDRLNGRAGDDHLTGGPGHDFLVGGPGHDVFDFNSVNDSVPGKDHDVIGDFHSSDRIDLHHIDADDGLAGNQHFDWIGNSAFSGQAGELRFERHGHDVTLQGDTNGDGTADFEVLLHHINVLHKHDVVL